MAASCLLTRMIGLAKAVRMVRERQTYPVPSLRVALLVGVGFVAVCIGTVSSVGRVPPVWAALLAVVGALMLTIGMLIYFARQVGRRR